MMDPLHWQLDKVTRCSEKNWAGIHDEFAHLHSHGLKQYHNVYSTKHCLTPKTGINKQNKLINPSGYVKHSKLCSEHALHLFFGGKVVAGESIRALVNSK